MKIVHYTIGLYPYRSGGLNRYATDLVKEQAKENDVSLLIPGGWWPFRGKCSISKARKQQGVECFYLNNALPLPLLYGIRKPNDFVKRKISKKSFELFYKEVKPEILHIHTLMGLSLDFLVFFKNKGVRIIFTSHDYFGICPKVNLINQKGELCQGSSSENCSLCNADSPLTIYLRVRNSSFFFFLRDIIKWLKGLINKAK